jgi:hypothetical protein
MQDWVILGPAASINPQEQRTMMEIRIDSQEDGADVKLARIGAQLVREGVTFKVTESNYQYRIELLGGY